MRAWSAATDTAPSNANTRSGFIEPGPGSSIRFSRSDVVRRAADAKPVGCSRNSWAENAPMISHRTGLQVSFPVLAAAGRVLDAGIGGRGRVPAHNHRIFRKGRFAVRPECRAKYRLRVGEQPGRAEVQRSRIPELHLSPFPSEPTAFVLVSNCTVAARVHRDRSAGDLEDGGLDLGTRIQ